MPCRPDKGKTGSARKTQSAKKGSRTYYYQIHPDGAITYIPQAEISLIRALAQKSYDIKILRCMERRMAGMRRFLSTCAKTDIGSIYRKTQPLRQALIHPVRSRREQKRDAWISVPVRSGTQPTFAADAPTIITERGERVRSKSEKILADYFYHHDIPYKYEEPLMLIGYGRVHPDFTFFSPVSGVEIYWEHFGRMDDPDYTQKAIRKIEAYADSGYDVGHRLLLTFETASSGLNMNSVDRLVKRHLLAPDTPN